jgi:hypothetical protein
MRGLRKVSQQDFFYGEELLAILPTSKPEDHPLLAVSIRNLRTLHALVTGTHIEWECSLYEHTIL